jgi:rfaE bifunctional protein kinase chain/domain
MNYNLKTLFKDRNILIIGDIMIDSYINGNVNRISPEAPVPVVNLVNNEYRLGGAANVAMNIKSLGANPIICSAIGDDNNGRLLINLLLDNNIKTNNIILSDERITTNKTRIVGNNQQLLRIDDEITEDISETLENIIYDKVEYLIKNNSIDAVIFEDYNKGLLTKELIVKIIDLCNDNNIITTVDPKKNNFLTYRNVTLFKPNLKELNDGLNLKIDLVNQESFETAVSKLEVVLMNRISLITLSEKGLFIKEDNKKYYVNTTPKKIFDVSGAGDTVIAIATLGLISNLPIDFIGYISNLGASIVCQQMGTASIDIDDLINEIKIIEL